MSELVDFWIRINLLSILVPALVVIGLGVIELIAG